MIYWENFHGSPFYFLINIIDIHFGEYMSKYENYIILEGATFDDYCDALDFSFGVNEGIVDTKTKASTIISSIFGKAKEDFNEIVEDFGIGYDVIIKAFKNKDIFLLMKAFGFQIKTILKALISLSNLAHSGLFKVFEELAKNNAVAKLKSGALKVDELLEQYPILKKVNGPVVAALLLYIWLNMTFIGSLDYDMNFTDIGKALRGDYSIADLFASPAGLMTLTLFATGPYFSVAWLGHAGYNLIVALTYTTVKKTAGVDKNIINNFKKKLDPLQHGV